MKALQYGGLPAIAMAPSADERQVPLRLLHRIWRTVSQADPIVNRHLLLLRFTLVNMIAFALIGVAAAQGWISDLLSAGGSAYSVVIAAVFAVGLVGSARRALEISRELNEIERFNSFPLTAPPSHLRGITSAKGESRAILGSSLRLKLAARIAPIRHIANSLVLLGLTGTVIGFIVALSGVRPDTAADASAIGPMISTLINGMSIALYTTLIGSLLHLWLMVNVRLLEGGTIRVFTATIELGEHHARI